MEHDVARAARQISSGRRGAYLFLICGGSLVALWALMLFESVETRVEHLEWVVAMVFNQTLGHDEVWDWSLLLASTDSGMVRLAVVLCLGRGGLGHLGAPAR